MISPCPVRDIDLIDGRSDEDDVSSYDEQECIPPDNLVFETDEEIECSECRAKGYFEYISSKEEACCKICGHRRCTDCQPPPT
jgi:hypothetical protein